jgi:glycosyltransferase involved in cell wall biosynthesis
LVNFPASIDNLFSRTGITVDADGRVVAEAMDAGLPVVAGNMGGSSKVVMEGECCFLVASQGKA